MGCHRLCLSLACVLGVSSCRDATPSRPVELIADVPAAQQRVVDRSELLEDWPLSARTGTLGCVSGAVVFRTGNVSYALNDPARARGFGAPEAIRVPAISGPPTNPLPRVPQDTRMAIFEHATRCDSTNSTSPANAAACRRRLRQSHGLSEADLKQIDAEGAERFWSPLVRPLMTLDPLVDMGMKLCGG